MNPDVRNEVGQRLKCVAGHVHGLRTMVDEERTVGEVLQQLHAIQGSLRMIRTLLLKEHLYESLQDGERQMFTNNMGLQKALDQILQLQDNS